MLYSTLLVVAAAFSSFATAQNGTTVIGDCCTVPASEVPDDLRESWCQASQNTCPEICGGQGQIASGGNDCNKTTLSFTCTCKNGTKPDMASYQQTVPGQMCRFWFDKCINATGDNLSEQFQCTSARDSQCGNLTTNGAEVSSSSRLSTATATGGGGSSSATTTAGGASASTGAAVALALAREYGTPALAGGMIALFGFAL